MVNGLVLHADGSTSDDAPGSHGSSVIRAEGRSEVLDLLRVHALLSVGGEYAIEVLEVPKR